MQFNKYIFLEFFRIYFYYRTRIVLVQTSAMDKLRDIYIYIQNDQVFSREFKDDLKIRGKFCACIYNFRGMGASLIMGQFKI